MTENLISTKKLTGTRVIKGKKLPRNAGKVHRFIFYPDQKRVAGFETKKSDFLLMFKRRGRFVAINGYYMYEDYAFIRNEKGASGKAAYKALNLYPDDSVLWIGLPVITEDGESVGVVNDVTFALPSGEVQSIEAGPKAMGKLTQGTRTIPVELIKGYSAAAETVETEAAEAEKKKLSPAIIVLTEALAIDIDTEKSIAAQAGKKASAIAGKVGVDSAAVSEKAKSAAQTAGAVASAGAAATGKQLKKAGGMFSAFKDAYNEGRHGE
ncbi:MAG: PRC-barrel domain-containing protein [Coriobacteriia bacterium]|nr:PRC-barrel domain-containing protein [Coriobacteriia bacterium]